MKPSTTLGLVAAAAIAAFCLGRMSSHSDVPSSSSPGPRPAGSGSSTGNSVRPAQGNKPLSSRASNSLERIPLERARQLTSKERLELIEKGSLIYDSGKQADLLCGVIATLTKDDISQAVELLAGAQDHGNFCSQAVWDAIWTQWGSVDPEGVLKVFNDKPNGKSRADARHLMAGWWETDPAGALAWAQEPKQSQHDAVAASLALTNSAGGDPQKLEQIMAAMPAKDARITECLRDYLDLASMNPNSSSATETYDQLPAGLKDAAWPVILQRLSYTDPASAANWLAQHASDPGYDGMASYNMIQKMANQSPQAAVELATQLPQSENSPDIAGTAIARWASSDRNAAVAWLEAQPATDERAQQWLGRLKPRQIQEQNIIWSGPDRK